MSLYVFLALCFISSLFCLSVLLLLFTKYNILGGKFVFDRGEQSPAFYGNRKASALQQQVNFRCSCIDETIQNATRVANLTEFFVSEYISTTVRRISAVGKRKKAPGQDKRKSSTGLPRDQKQRKTRDKDV